MGAGITRPGKPLSKRLTSKAPGTAKNAHPVNLKVHLSAANLKFLSVSLLAHYRNFKFKAALESIIY
jgi:hypothetical protein